jgi:hypothetical protein
MTITTRGGVQKKIALQTAERPEKFLGLNVQGIELTN